MKLESYEFRDPGALVEDLAGRRLLTDGSVHLLLVAEPNVAQRIVHVETLETPAVIDDWMDARDEMRALIDAWEVPDAVPPTHAGVLVVVRRGLCVFGANEAHWHNAWRYVNHFHRMYSGNVVLVTEHGWTDFMSAYAGRAPALQPSGRRGAR